MPMLDILAHPADFSARQLRAADFSQARQGLKPGLKEGRAQKGLRGTHGNGRLHRSQFRGPGAASGALRHRRAPGVQGHRRGGGKFQFLPADRPRGLHPDPLRKARGRRRPALFPGADGAHGPPRHRLPPAPSHPRRPPARHAEPAIGGSADLPRRHFAAPPRRGALRRGRGGPGRPAQGRRGLFAHPPQCPGAFRLAAPGRSHRRRRQHRGRADGADRGQPGRHGGELAPAPA